MIVARDARLVHGTDENGHTPLHHAAARGREAVARVLLAAGAVRNATDDEGRTPLHLAANKSHTAMVALLS